MNHSNGETDMQRGVVRGRTGRRALSALVAGGLAGVDALVSAGRGLGLEDQTLRDAAVRALELR